MSDPYRSSNYHTSTYNPSSYAPQDAYVSGALTTRPGSSGYDDSRGYYPSQSNMELSQSSYRRSSGGRDSNYLDPDGHRSNRRHKSSRSHSRHDDYHERDRDGKGGRERSKSRGKEWGATAVGGAAGAFIGNEIGHGPLGVAGGLIAGAIGAHELERRHEKHQAKKRLEEDGGRPSHHRRRSSGGLLNDVKGKVEGFLNPDGGDKRRSRSHVGSSRKSARDYDDYDSYSDDEKYERRSSKGGRSRRDDY